MKVLMAIFIVILMIGVAPAFAANSPADQQTAAPTAVKQINGNIEKAFQVADPSSEDIMASSDESDLEDSDYIDGYDDEGNYIGNYIVVNPSNDEPDEYTVSSFNMTGDDIDYIDGPDSGNVPASTNIDEFDQYTDEDSLELGNTFDEDDDYTVEFDASTHTDENDNFDELNADDQFDEDGYDIFTELNIEFEDNGLLYIDQLNESQDWDVNELDDGNYAVVDPLDVPSSEDTSQVDINVSTPCKPLIVTIVNGLCGVVQATLQRLGNVCMILGNELETVF